MFSNAELTAMRETQQAHMMDVCMIYRVVGKEKDSRGTYQKKLDSGMRSICGLQMSIEGKYQSSSNQYSVVDIDAILRLPHGVTVKPDDEIEIVKRFGSCIEPIRYEVARFTAEGPSGGRAYLKARTVL